MSQRVKDGGPAFPRPFSYDTHDDHTCRSQTGISLRDYFAIRFAPVLLADIFSQKDFPEQKMAFSFKELGEHAYKLADAMLVARDKSESPSEQQESTHVDAYMDTGGNFIWRTRT